MFLLYILVTFGVFRKLTFTIIILFLIGFFRKAYHSFIFASFFTDSNMPLFIPDKQNLQAQIYWYLRCLIYDYIDLSPEFRDNGHKWYFQQRRARYDYILGCYPELQSILIQSLRPIKMCAESTCLVNVYCSYDGLNVHERYPDIISNVLPSGSISENVSDVFKTDFDVMYIMREEGLKELGVIDRRAKYLHLYIKKDAPCYVRLVAVDVQNSCTIVQSRRFRQIINVFQKTALHPTLQMMKDKDFLWSKTVGSSYQGPAMTSVVEFPNGKQIQCDYVFALELTQAVTSFIFSKWINRVQEKQVFSDTQLAEVKKSLQCYIVPVGLNKEDDEHWRLSFSATETAIFSNIETLNRDVYYYAKLVLNHLTVIPSYFLKTAFFWLMEDVPRRKWTPKAPFNLIRWLFHKLWMFLVKNFLPHFFIPTQNLLLTKTSNEMRTYLQQCTLCLYQWQTVHNRDSINGTFPLLQYLQKKILDDKENDIQKGWPFIKEHVLQITASTTEIMVENMIENSSTFYHFDDNFNSAAIFCKSLIDALHLCPHIPFSAFLDLCIAAVLRGVDIWPPVETKSNQREKVLLLLNICFGRSVEHILGKRKHFYSEATRRYEYLLDQSSISVVRETDLYITHLLSTIGRRHTMLCLQELLLLSARKCSSINLEYSGISRFYCDLMDLMNSKITDINHFTLKGGNVHKSGLKAINKLQTTVTLFYANFCVREHIFDAAKVLRKVLSLAKVQPTVDLHLWQLPLFDHCEQLCECLDMSKQRKPLGYRSVELSLQFFCQCMSAKIDKVLVYDRTQASNTDLPKHMEVAQMLLSNQYSKTDLLVAINRHLEEL